MTSICGKSTRGRFVLIVNSSRDGDGQPRYTDYIPGPRKENPGPPLSHADGPVPSQKHPNLSPEETRPRCYS